MAAVIAEWLIEFGRDRRAFTWFWCCLKCWQRQDYETFWAASIAAREHAESHSPSTLAGDPG